MREDNCPLCVLCPFFQFMFLPVSRWVYDNLGRGKMCELELASPVQLEVSGARRDVETPTLIDIRASQDGAVPAGPRPKVDRSLEADVSLAALEWKSPPVPDGTGFAFESVLMCSN